MIGPHSDEKQETVEFWQSSTVANASNGKSLRGINDLFIHSTGEGKNSFSEDCG